MSTWRILVGDVREWLAELPAGSVQTCVTSPPYWNLRDYQVSGQLGLEPTPAAYVANMVAVFAEVWRVLRDDGTCWINLGDSYNAYNGNRGASTSFQAATEGANPKLPGGYGLTCKALKPKDLVGIPWSVAFALRDAGWYLRSDIIWAKPNPMPESVTDRPTKSHEYLFLLAKSERYYYDAAAIAETAAPHRGDVLDNRESGTGKARGLNGQADRQGNFKALEFGRNKRTVWTVATQPYPEAHFATYPEDLITPCILAGTSEKGQCPQCGAPWERVSERIGQGHDGSRYGARVVEASGGALAGGTARSTLGSSNGKLTGKSATLGWQPSCACNAGDPVPQLVLDPFTGSGTTGAVAIRHQRSFVGCELNPEYVELARTRIGSVAPMFAEEVA